MKLDELPSTAARAGQGELSDEQATAVIDGIWHWTDPPDDSG